MWCFGILRGFRYMNLIFRSCCCRLYYLSYFMKLWCIAVLKRSGRYPWKKSCWNKRRTGWPDYGPVYEGDGRDCRRKPAVLFLVCPAKLELKLHPVKTKTISFILLLCCQYSRKCCHAESEQPRNAAGGKNCKYAKNEQASLYRIRPLQYGMDK